MSNVDLTPLSSTSLRLRAAFHGGEGIALTVFGGLFGIATSSPLALALALAAAGNTYYRLNRAEKQIDLAVSREQGVVAMNSQGPQANP